MADDAITPFLRGYIVCELWAWTDDDGRPFDREPHLRGPLGPKPSRAWRLIAPAVQESCAADLNGLDPETSGHDFWLTRNGHGAGFWDRGLGARGERLTTAAKAYGESVLYVSRAVRWRWRDDAP